MDTTEQRVRVFDEAFLSDLATFGVVRIHSAPVSPPFESVRLSAVVHNSSAGGGGQTLALVLEGSYDGAIWQTAGLSGLTITATLQAEYATSQHIQVSYAFLRLRASVTSNDGDAQFLFTAFLLFSHK